MIPPIRQKFNQLLNFDDDEHNQDWHLIFADETRLDEFIQCYQQYAIDEHEKSLMMELIVASFDLYFWEENQDLVMWARIEALLQSEHPLFAYIINYWCLWDVTESREQHPDYFFNITFLMRELSQTLQ
ncbi:MULTISPECIES: hypothetical protein [unclassified Acinetobacter]|uniref:hypothetical protein n=1 Tax=unclassified Acinetobacter TaxID=196816 RepID=UPI0035B80EC4